MLELQREEGVMTALLTGELDQHRCALLRKKIDSATERERPRVLCLDFSRVQFMDSSGIGLVMGRYRQMSMLGGRLKVVNVPAHLEKMFTLSGLQRLGVM